MIVGLMMEHLKEEIEILNYELRRIAGEIRDLETSYGSKANRQSLEAWKMREIALRRILSRSEYQLERLRKKSEYMPV